jgi:hypothetical protein
MIPISITWWRPWITLRPLADDRPWIHPREFARVQGPADYGPTHDRKLTALVDEIASAISAMRDLAARLYNQSFRRAENKGVAA